MVVFRSRRKKLALLAILIEENARKGWLKKKLLQRANRLLRKGNVRRDREEAIRLIDEFPDYIFKSMYRLDRTAFDSVLEKLETINPKNTNTEIYSRRSVADSRGQPIANKTKLLCTLRFLAGGSKWDIAFAHRVGWGTFFADTRNDIVWPTMDAIDKMN